MEDDHKNVLSEKDLKQRRKRTARWAKAVSRRGGRRLLGERGLLGKKLATQTGKRMLLERKGGRTSVEPWELTTTLKEGVGKLKANFRGRKREKANWGRGPIKKGMSSRRGTQKSNTSERGGVSSCSSPWGLCAGEGAGPNIWEEKTS